MSKTIVICGYGPGVSDSVAVRFGKEDFNIAIACRSIERLKEAERSLAIRGVRATGFKADLTSPEQTKALIENVHRKLGSIKVIHWNSYAYGAGDLIKTDLTVLRALLDVSVSSLVVAVQASLQDLHALGGALLMTNGAYALLDSKIDAMAVQRGFMGLALANAAKHKLTRLLAERLRPEGIYVGEVMIAGLVKGTPSDKGSATVSPSEVADAFWSLYMNRTEFSVTIR